MGVIHIFAFNAHLIFISIIAAYFQAPAHSSALDATAVLGSVD